MIPNDTWKKLETELPIGECITSRLALPEISRKLYIGFDSNKQRHLLIPLNENEDDYNDSQSRGLSVTTRNLIILGFEPKKYIDIICHDPAGYTIFDVIASEIAEKLDKGSSKEVVIGVVSKWRHFWGNLPKELLSYEEIIGLFAELWFLYNWLLPKTDYVSAVNRWRGPFSSRHDFEWVGTSVEVKATTGVKSRSHRINGIDQLSPPQNGNLFFFSLRLREEQGSENTLPGLISLFQEKLKDDIDALSKFENTLAVLGYSPMHDKEYLKFRFRIVDEKLYEVKNGFPRITTDSFVEKSLNGISQLTYTINLDGFDDLCIAKTPVDFKD